MPTQPPPERGYGTVQPRRPLPPLSRALLRIMPWLAATLAAFALGFQFGANL